MSVFSESVQDQRYSIWRSEHTVLPFSALRTQGRTKKAPTPCFLLLMQISMTALGFRSSKNPIKSCDPHSLLFFLPVLPISPSFCPLPGSHLISTPSNPSELRASPLCFQQHCSKDFRPPATFYRSLSYLQSLIQMPQDVMMHNLICYLFWEPNTRFPLLQTEGDTFLYTFLMASGQYDARLVPNKHIKH